MSGTNKGKSQYQQPQARVESTGELLIRIPSTILHLIDNQQSVELAFGHLEIILLRQNHAGVAVLARIGDQIQWPLTKDQSSVKLDESHYFFTLNTKDGVLNYGLTIPSRGQHHLLSELDTILDRYTGFSERSVSGGEDVRWWKVAREAGPDELENDEGKRQEVEETCAAYWTTLAPNVDDYSSSVSRMIASSSGQVVRVILWCGDVTVDRIRWGNELLKKRMGPNYKKQDARVSPQCLDRIMRVKKMTKMSEDVATGILTGVVKVSETVTGSIVKSKAGKKFFNMLPGEIILATLEGFNKVCDAVEVASRNVMSKSTQVTREVVKEKYGEEASHATGEGLGAAGHAMGTAWAVFKLRKALYPKKAFKPSTLVKAAAATNSNSNSSSSS